MKSILVPLRASEDIDGALAAAVAVAARFDGYVEGLVVEPVVRMVVGEALAAVPSYDAQLLEDWRNRAKAARARFDSVIKAAGLDGKKSSGWRELKGPESGAVGEHGRLFDLIVIGRGPEDDPGEATELLEAALFDSGRPVLLAPRKPVERLGQTIVISWNGSTETARTIALGLPLLDAAKAVHVLTVEGVTVPGPSGQEVAEYLGRRGVKATAVTAGTGGRADGEAILEEAAALGADLLFKGAYTQSRLRQMVFGGPTRHILTHADLPVLMAH